MNSQFFKRSEFECSCGCGFAVVDTELLEVLEDVREWFKKPVIITGGNRCQKHNIQVGGALKSQHVFGMACDFKVQGVHEDEISTYLKITYPEKYGIGRYSGRTHIDVREFPARWDNRKREA